MKQCSIVIDLGFGDAGKGISTNFLVSQNPKSSLVIRFSGGHQVGHTVNSNGECHTFSNFGSGSFHGVPTYYSEHTTIFPSAILKEYEAIKHLDPKLIFHPLTMVTTAYDIAYNRAFEKLYKHGSCGVGFGATIERNEAGIHLFANDFQYGWLIEQKLKGIARYYEEKIELNKNLQKIYFDELSGYNDSSFIENCDRLKQLYSFATLEQLENNYDNFIFEGSQGILLDKKFGFWPHNTWSNTTSQNALDLIIKIFNLQNTVVNIYYVTRTYQTRHGNGPMSDQSIIDLTISNEEANQENDFQGVFRTGKLDVRLLNYALSCDGINHGKLLINKNLIVTCMDQRPTFDIEKLLQKLSISFHEIWGSFSPDSKHFKRIK